MKNVNYANIAQNLLGDELYCKFIKEISKEYQIGSLVDFGQKLINKCCFIIIMIGFSKKVKLDNVKICLENETIEISCKEFAEKYELYARKIENDVFETAKT